MAVITWETECFPHKKSEQKKFAPTCSAFYLSSHEWGALSIQMANHQGFYTFTLSKNTEERSAFSIMFWKRAGCSGFNVRADFPLAQSSASLREWDRDRDHISATWKHFPKASKGAMVPYEWCRISWIASGSHSLFCHVRWNHISPHSA